MHRCEWQCREICHFCHWPIENNPPLRREGEESLTREWVFRATTVPSCVVKTYKQS